MACSIVPTLRLSLFLMKWHNATRWTEQPAPCSIDILSIDILTIDILSIDILSIDILSIDILSIGILSIGIYPVYSLFERFTGILFASQQEPAR